MVVASAGALLYDLACGTVDADRERSGFGLVVAAIAPAIALVGSPWQIEAASVGSSAVGAWLIVLVVWLSALAARRASGTAWVGGALALALGLALGQEPGVFASALAGCGATLAATPSGRAAARGMSADATRLLRLFAAGLLPFALALIHMRTTATPSVASDDWTQHASAATTVAAFATRELGGVLLVLALAGVVLAWGRGRSVAAGLSAVAVAGLISGWAGAAMGPSVFAAPVLAGAAATAALAAPSMLALVRTVASAKLPLAKVAAGLFVVLEAVMPVEAADEALTRADRGGSGAAAWWDDAAWSALPARAVVLVDDERVATRAAAARAQALLRSDVVFVGASNPLVPRASARAADLVPLWRDLALTGAPSEAAVSALATTRFVAAINDPRWGVSVGRHLVPLALVDRVEPEPRGASERRLALASFSEARRDLRSRLDGDVELLAATSVVLRARASLLASMGEREGAARATADALAFEAP
jgi:hypothetical protein